MRVLGRIVVKANAADATASVILSVRDEGQGLPDDFSMGRAQSLGMKIIRALVEQMGASLTINSAQPGAEFVAEIPIDPRTNVDAGG